MPIGKLLDIVRTSAYRALLTKSLEVSEATAAIVDATSVVSWFGMPQSPTDKNVSKLDDRLKASALWQELRQ